MPEQSKNTMLWRQVKNESDPMQAVHMIADYAESAISDSLADRKDLRDLCWKLRESSKEDIKELRVILLGNGHPETSVVTRLARLEQSQCKANENTSKLVWLIITVIATQLLTVLLRMLGTI